MQRIFQNEKNKHSMLILKLKLLLIILIVLLLEVFVVVKSLLFQSKRLEVISSSVIVELLILNKARVSMEQLQFLIINITLLVVSGYGSRLLELLSLIMYFFIIINMMKSSIIN